MDRPTHQPGRKGHYMDRNQTPIMHTINGSLKVSGLSRTRTYKALRDGEITARKLGKRTLIEHESLMAYLKALPVYGKGA
jgi:excisionase family DNA binding protein